MIGTGFGGAEKVRAQNELSVLISFGVSVAVGRACIDDAFRRRRRPGDSGWRICFRFLKSNIDLRARLATTYGQVHFGDRFAKGAPNASNRGRVRGVWGSACAQIRQQATLPEDLFHLAYVHGKRIVSDHAERHARRSDKCSLSTVETIGHGALTWKIRFAQLLQILKKGYFCLSHHHGEKHLLFRSCGVVLVELHLVLDLGGHGEGVDTRVEVVSACKRYK